MTFRVTNWGESHGKAIGALVRGCPPLIPLNEKDIQKELDRRKPGKSAISSSRREDDKVEILSGVFEGKTTGAPISLIIFNKDFRTQDYDDLKNVFRPGHADFTYFSKYGMRDHRGGGSSSGRLTAASVAAGAVAKKVLSRQGIEILAYTKQIKNIRANIDSEKVTLAKIESNIVRCPDSRSAAKMIELIQKTMQNGDSVGGIVECIARNVPAGLGEPLLDKIDADLAKAMLGINAVKGFEIGSGFACAQMYGSEHNDPFVCEKGKITTTTNNAGGVLGGITTGMPIIFRVAFKPTSTIAKAQKTVDIKGKQVILRARGRHDPCIVPRAVSVVEAMTAIVLLDHILRTKSI